MLNSQPDAVADVLRRAQRLEPEAARLSRRLGLYERKLDTWAGKVTVWLASLRNLPTQTAIRERNLRRD